MWKIVIILLLVYINSSETKRDFSIDITACSFVPNSDLFKNANCRAIKKKPLVYIDGEFSLSRTVNNFSMRTSFDMLRKDNTKINMMKFDLDGCKFLEASYSNNLLQFSLRELLRASNLPTKCPIMEGIVMQVRNYTVNPDDYPPFVPSMSWILVTQFQADGSHQGDLVIKGSVRKA